MKTLTYLLIGLCATIAVPAAGSCQDGFDDKKLVAQMPIPLPKPPADTGGDDQGRLERECENPDCSKLL